MEYRQNKRLSIAMGLVLTAFLPAFVKAAPPQVGEPAPALALEKVLQGAEGAKADWDSLRGKVVVLEFWATWCGPCVTNIPFLNKLTDALKDKPVQFISITDETESVVAAFLKKSPIPGWIGLDTDGSAFKAYGILPRPTTVVVDQQGKLVGWTTLGTLVDHPEILDDLLAGKPRKLGGPPEPLSSDVLAELGLNAEELAGAEQNPPLCVIVIRPAQPIEKWLKSGSGRKDFYRAVTLRSAIASLYNVAWYRIISSVPLPEDKKYDIIFSWPKGDYRRGRALLRQAIEATFGLSIRREKRMMDVYVLTVSPGRTPTLEPKVTRMFNDPETGNWAPTEELLERMNAGEKFFHAIGNTNRIAMHLDYYLGRPVVDETGIEGSYSAYFPYDFEKPDREALIKTVEEKYGLKLAPAQREIEVLVIEASSTDSVGSR